MARLCADVDTPELSRMLWFGGRLVEKILTTNVRVCFGSWIDHGEKPRTPVDLSPSQVLLTCPISTYMYVSRRDTALRGAVQAVDSETTSMVPWQIKNVATYLKMDSAMIAHKVTF